MQLDLHKFDLHWVDPLRLHLHKLDMHRPDSLMAYPYVSYCENAPILFYLVSLSIFSRAVSTTLLFKLGENFREISQSFTSFICYLEIAGNQGSSLIDSGWSLDFGVRFDLNGNNAIMEATGNSMGTTKSFPKLFVECKIRPLLRKLRAFKAL